MSPLQEGLLDSEQWERHQKHEFLQTAHDTAQWTLDLLRPSVLTRSGIRKQVRGTAYLDGLRGFAAMLVYWHHHQLWPRQLAGGIFESAWGFRDDFFFCAFPGIRTFFTGGHFSVAVFFVISGYVLSAKPLALIYAGEHAKLGDNLASALFRRWLRLHIPVIFVSLLYITSWHLFGIWTLSPKHKATFSEELWNWYIEFKNFSFVFRTGDSGWMLTSQFHAWSIPVEFRGSIIIYTSVLAFSRATRNARLWCQIGLIFYFLYIVDGYFGALFVGGMLLCELTILSKANNLPRFISNLSPYKKPIFYTLFIVGIYLSGVPSFSQDIFELRKARGWYFLSFLKPQAVFDLKWFYLFWAALFVVASIPHISWLKAFFETPFNQYLGRISFALYLVHGPVLWVLGDRLYQAVGWYREEHVIHTPSWINLFPLSQKGPLGLEISFLAPHLILLPLTLWLAEIVTKLFDEPSVRFSQWAYGKVLPSDD
jgi:peptidoglycan/LPS O-acetylase OafA/YrhL